MATTAITPYQLVKNTNVAKLGAATGTVAATPADGWVIAAGDRDGDILLVKFVADGSGDTVIVLAGDDPPALKKGQGNLTITLGASVAHVVALEAARFMQNDGTIKATCTDAGTLCEAVIMPR